MHFRHLYKNRRVLPIARIIVGLILCLFIVPTAKHLLEFVYDITESDLPQFTSDGPSSDSNPLFFIPQKTIRLWQAKDFLVVFGIPSLDIPIRRWRRRMQRVTCWQLPEVATRQNKFTGAFLPLYLLARHPINNLSLSAEVVDEAEQWHDVIIHPMSEGKITTNKANDGKGEWGIEAQIGSGRKTFFWFYFALRKFPQVPFIGKGDDDMFLRVPQYLTDLRHLPRSKTFWGNDGTTMAKINKNGEKIKVKFLLGFCMTLARDVVKQFVSYKPMQRLASLPYSKELEPEFIFLAVQSEDIMVGRVLQLTGYRFITFAEGGLRFHMDPRVPLSKNFVVTHLPPEDEYYFLMKKTLVNATTTQPTIIIKKTPFFYFIRPPYE